MSVKSGRHFKPSTETLNKLLYLSERCASASPKIITPWERELLNDRLAAIREYGGSAVMTIKQMTIIEEIYLRCKLVERPDF